MTLHALANAKGVHPTARKSVKSFADSLLKALNRERDASHAISYDAMLEALSSTCRMGNWNAFSVALDDMDKAVPVSSAALSIPQPHPSMDKGKGDIRILNGRHVTGLEDVFSQMHSHMVCGTSRTAHFMARALVLAQPPIGSTGVPRLNILHGRDHAWDGTLSVLAGERPDDVSHVRLWRDGCLNPFDLPTGHRTPGTIQRKILRDILMLMASMSTKRAKAKPEEHMEALCDMVIECLYERYTDLGRGYSKLYIPGTEPEVDAALSAHGTVTDDLTWWMLVDLFLSQGTPTLATLAQRHAVPDISDVPSTLYSHEVVDAFSDDKKGIVGILSAGISHVLRANVAKPVCGATSIPLFILRKPTLALDCRMEPHGDASSGMNYLGWLAGACLMTLRHLSESGEVPESNRTLDGSMLLLGHRRRSMLVLDDIDTGSLEATATRLDIAHRIMSDAGTHPLRAVVALTQQLESRLHSPGLEKCIALKWSEGGLNQDLWSKEALTKCSEMGILPLTMQNIQDYGCDKSSNSSLEVDALSSWLLSREPGDRMTMTALETRMGKAAAMDLLVSRFPDGTCMPVLLSKVDMMTVDEDDLLTCRDLLQLAVYALADELATEARSTARVTP